MNFGIKYHVNVPLKMINKSENKRPDGLDVARYENRETWSYHQWAWEFLRRNEKFIKECKLVKLGKSSKQKVAREFGLKKYKSYTEPYLKKGSTPQFSIVTPFLWHNLGEMERKVERVSLNLFPGQAIVRIDLAAAIEHKGAIEAQVIMAKKMIDEKVANYISRNKELQTSHKRKEETFGLYIRLLDLKSARKTNLECAEILLKTDVGNNADSDELREKIKQRLKAARMMANNDYRYLSVRDGSPKKGTLIPLEA